MSTRRSGADEDAMLMACGRGIPHINGPACIRVAGHAGLCWSRWEHMPGGSIQRTEWVSAGGYFFRSEPGRTIYPENARERQNG